MARKTSLLCSQCGKLISAEEKKCPYCGALQPSLFGFAPVLRDLFGNRIDMVMLVVAGCVGLYIISLALDPDAVLQMRGILSIGSPSGRALALLGAAGGVAGYCGFEWTLLTANFLHGGILHILFNVMWIRSLGPTAVQIFGSARFFVVYMVTGVAGFFASTMLGDHMTIGASAAIFGLMGLLAGWGRRRGGTVGAHLSFEMWRWGAIVVALCFMIPGIDNTAHIGGFVAGFAMAWILPRDEGARETRIWQILALLLLVATVASFGLSVWKMWPWFSSETLPCAVSPHGG